CDPEKIGRVITNLAINAMKFCAEGGRARIWARADDGSDDVVVSVTDNGPGIAPESLQEIFQRFKQLDQNVRASTKGFGLGLNIARELVRLNFGEIEVESSVGMGSTFRFTIPKASARAIVPRWLASVRAARPGSDHVSLVAAAVPHATVAQATAVQH